MQRIISLLLFIAIFFGGIFYVRPLWDEVSALASERDQKINERDNLSMQLNKLKQAQNNLSTSSEISRQIFLNAIPERFQQDEIIRNLHKLAEENDVSINAIQFNVSTSSLDQIKRGTINLSLQSDESRLVSFLEAIESNERKFVVKNITVTSSQEEDGSVPRVVFNLTLETYFQNSL